MRLFVFSISLIILTGTPLFASVRDELASVKKKINEKRALLKKSARVESQVSSEIQEIERTLATRQGELKRLQAELRKIREEIDACRQERDEVQREADERKRSIERRLRSLYKAGEIGVFRMFFSAESFPQMSETMVYTRSVVDHDRKMVEEYRRTLARLDELEKRLQKNRDRLEGVDRQVRAKTREIEAEKIKKDETLRKIREEKKGYQASIRDLQADARRLQAMIERLEAAGRARYSTSPGTRDAGKKPLPPVADSGFGAQKGKLRLPVNGTITTRFGRHKHPEFNSYTVSNGLSISAPAGTPVTAVYAGTIIYAGYFRGYGNMMIIDHGAGYYSLYAHNASLSGKEGGSVDRGDVIARVGDVDSTSGPKLYFEIRYQGRPVDPEMWVK